MKYEYVSNNNLHKKKEDIAPLQGDVLFFN